MMHRKVCKPKDKSSACERRSTQKALAIRNDCIVRWQGFGHADVLDPPAASSSLLGLAGQATQPICAGILLNG
jgi:hypothetical protein